MTDCLKVCPRCGSEVAVFFINFEEAISMCIQLQCSYPLQEEGELRLIPKAEAIKLVKKRSISKSDLLKLTMNGKLINQMNKEGTSQAQDSADKLIALLDEFDLDSILEHSSSPQDDCKLADILKEVEGDLFRNFVEK